MVTLTPGAHPRLHLFLGVAVRLEGVDVGNHVEGQGVREDLGRHDLPVQVPLRALEQLSHARRAGAAGRLVRREDRLLEGELLVQRPQSHRGDRRGAVWVGDEQLALHGGAVHLGHDQGDAVVAAERAGVVDDLGRVPGGT